MIAADVELEGASRCIRMRERTAAKNPGRRAMAESLAGRVVVTPEAGTEQHPGVPRAHRRHPSQFGKAAALGKGKRHAKQLPGIWRKRAEAKAKQKAAMVVYKMPEFKQSA